TALVDQEGERLGCLAQPFLNLPFRSGFAHGNSDPLRLCKDASHREHEKRADPLLAGQRKDSFSGALMHHVERNHEDIPEAVVSCPGKHLMLVVLGGKLGNTNMPDFSFRLLLDQGWDKCVSGMSVGRHRNAMKLEYVNMVSTQEPERTLQTFHHLRRSTPLAISS